MTTEAQEVTTVDELSTSLCWRRSCWRTFDPGSYTEIGRPMTTGALEVTTLQLRFEGGEGGAR